jgi:hypothetical protein
MNATRGTVDASGDLLEEGDQSRLFQRRAAGKRTVMIRKRREASTVIVLAASEWGG